MLMQIHRRYGITGLRETQSDGCRRYPGTSSAEVLADAVSLQLRFEKRRVNTTSSTMSPTTPPAAAPKTAGEMPRARS